MSARADDRLPPRERAICITRELGEFDTKTVVSKTVGIIFAAKADQHTPTWQKEFFADSARPLETKYQIGTSARRLCAVRLQSCRRC
jgi:hypothetical protein